MNLNEQNDYQQSLELHFLQKSGGAMAPPAPLSSEALNLCWGLKINVPNF